MDVEPSFVFLIVFGPLVALAVLVVGIRLYVKFKGRGLFD